MPTGKSIFTLGGNDAACRTASCGRGGQIRDGSKISAAGVGNATGAEGKHRQVFTQRDGGCWHKKNNSISYYGEYT